jgi:hypothetical protein
MGSGYKIEGEQIVQISSTSADQELTAPALALLAGYKYATANKHFRSAYRSSIKGIMMIEGYIIWA